jgi:hypothetical protein
MLQSSIFAVASHHGVARSRVKGPPGRAQRACPWDPKTGEVGQGSVKMLFGVRGACFTD